MDKASNLENRQTKTAMKRAGVAEPPKGKSYNIPSRHGESEQNLSPKQVFSKDWDTWHRALMFPSDQAETDWFIASTG